MKTIKQIATIICLFCYSAGAFSQILQPPVAALSPNAASLAI